MRREKNMTGIMIERDLSRAVQTYEDNIFLYGTLLGPLRPFIPEELETVRYFRTVILMRSLRAKRAKRRRGVPRSNLIDNPSMEVSHDGFRRR